jgi:hypothetical protein
MNSSDKNSGMSNFNTFVMEDFLGAGFFHLILGPLVAVILGTVAGLLGKTVSRLMKRER